MPGPTWSDPNSQLPSIFLYCLWAACRRRCKHKSRLSSCHACFNFSRLHSGSASGLHMLHNINLREIFECTHLKFTVSGRSKQASNQANIHTHMRNAITLVWGSLRFAPMKLTEQFWNWTKFATSLWTWLTLQFLLPEGKSHKMTVQVTNVRIYVSDYAH